MTSAPPFLQINLKCEKRVQVEGHSHSKKSRWPRWRSAVLATALLKWLGPLQQHHGAQKTSVGSRSRCAAGELPIQPHTS